MAEGERAHGPQLLPDGRTVVFTLARGSNWDDAQIVAQSLDTGDSEPLWARDGQRLIFRSMRTGIANLYRQAADGGGSVERLTDGTRIRGADALTRDGKALVLRELDGNGGFDLTLLELDDAPVAKPHVSGTRPLVQSRFTESNGEISPDGRWLAFQFNSSGAVNIHVRPFDNPDGPQSQVSPTGGTEPLWSRDGRHLFYRDPTGAMMRVPVALGATFRAGTPAVLFNQPSYTLGGKGELARFLSRSYDVAADNRFLMIKGVDGSDLGAEAIVIVQNWFEELTRRVE